MIPEALANIWILSGPTGSGKSALALELAERHPIEIVAMDSMTLYRGMDIGTAKPTPAERERVPHHLIDILDPWQSSSVAWWLDQAAAVCTDIRSRGRQPLFVGGTPLYLKALLHGLFEGPPADLALRQRLENEADQPGAISLHERLRAVDPVAAGRLHANDRRRLVRALEVWELTGRPMSSWQQEWAIQPTSLPIATPEVAWWPQGVRVVWLDWPRDQLHRRIEQRVEAMFQAGWLEEVRRLQALEQPLSREAAAALGYVDVMGHLAGKVSLRDAIARIQAKSRQYARRQLTWFRAMPGAVSIDPKLTSAPLHTRI